jgi:hypothetical protein
MSVAGQIQSKSGALIRFASWSLALSRADIQFLGAREHVMARTRVRGMRCPHHLGEVGYRLLALFSLECRSCPRARDHVGPIVGTCLGGRRSGTFAHGLYGVPRLTQQASEASRSQRQPAISSSD